MSGNTGMQLFFYLHGRSPVGQRLTVDLVKTALETFCSQKRSFVISPPFAAMCFMFTITDKRHSLLSTSLESLIYSQTEVYLSGNSPLSIFSSPPPEWDPS